MRVFLSAFMANIAISSTQAHWDDLVSSLSSEARFGIPSESDDWIEECVRPYANDAPIQPVSNYQLFEAPSGVCQVHLVCLYDRCEPFADVLFQGQATYDPTIFRDDFWKYTPGLDLPAAVVHPKHVGDISTTIQYASEQNIGMSVKTSGHSYTGSNMKKDTILLHLSSLQKYSPHGSIVECDADEIPEGAYQDACDLATARSKPAVVRVGGGEIWDEVLRAVNFDWNSANPDKKYHVLSGAAGTVSVAGGWLASGGLSGNNGMRTYGVGVDQVLQVEMVLPSAIHVRFGPTSWQHVEGMMYPQTTEVTGYCNVGNLTDEDYWDWQECDVDVSFEDLWFAVRGGGGGTYGVITSIFYQLHDYPSPMQGIQVFPVISDPEAFQSFYSKWIEFLLKFFYDPESVGVSVEQSNTCSTWAAGGFLGGWYYCYLEAGTAMKNAWADFYGNEFGILSVDEYFSVTDYDSYADLRVEVGYNLPGVPDGRASDVPGPEVLPSFNSFTETNILQFMMFPLETIETKMDELVELILYGIVSGAIERGGTYVQGGNIPMASDGMDSFPIHRRHGGFLLYAVTDPAYRTRFQQLFYGVEDGEPYVGETFPGALCHNHAGMDFPTPLKSDWTVGCNPFWSEEEKAEKCFSYQEASWGEEILPKLEKIHSAVDPNHLFQCTDGVGYANEDKKSKKGKKKRDNA